MGKNKNKKKNVTKAATNVSNVDNEPKIVELSSDDEEDKKSTKEEPMKNKSSKKKQQQEKSSSSSVKEEGDEKGAQCGSTTEKAGAEKKNNETVKDDKVEKATSEKATSEQKTDAKEDAAADTESQKQPGTAKLPQGDCAVCGTLAKSFCSVCKHVFYCKREHQKQHWSYHKEECKSMVKLPYRIERNEQMGRYLVATTDLDPGQLIFNEMPMIVGPRQLSKPVCLGCHKELTGPDKITICSRCYWPLCSRKCEDSPLHDPECRIIRAGGQKVKVDIFGQINMMYACITVLRALALKEGPQKVWTEYTVFESHLQERMGTPVYNKVNKEKVVYFIQHYLGLLSGYSDLEILEACGKLDTNCFEIKQSGLNLRAMYRTASILSHECRPNTKHTFDPDYGVNIYATVPIPKGSTISVSYTQPLWSTMNRRQHLKMSKCFWCQCQRCLDPTEYGSFLSALNCSKCGGKVLSSDPLNHDAPWRCATCAHTLDAKQVRTGQDRLTEELKQIDRSNPQNLEDFLKKYATILPDTHQLVREIQYSLVCLFKQVRIDQLQTNQLLRKSVLCKSLLDLSDKIEPGLTKWRGQLLFELQSASVVLTQRALDERRIEKYKAKDIFEENLQHLRESIMILQVEPDGKEYLQDELRKLAKILEDMVEEEED